MRSEIRMALTISPEAISVVQTLDFDILQNPFQISKDFLWFLLHFQVLMTTTTILFNFEKKEIVIQCSRYVLCSRQQIYSYSKNHTSLQSRFSTSSLLGMSDYFAEYLEVFMLYQKYSNWVLVFLNQKWNFSQWLLPIESFNML